MGLFVLIRHLPADPVLWTADAALTVAAAALAFVHGRRRRRTTDHAAVTPR
jgi:hypothetical protein